MQPIVAPLFATKYWTEPLAIDRAVCELKQRLAPFPVCPVIDGRTDEVESGEDMLLIALPMSGAVQPHLLSLAARFDRVILYAGYMEGNVSPELSAKMLTANAAPTLMDTYATLKRERQVLLALTQDALQDLVHEDELLCSVRGKKILLIGGVEPWVVSPSTDPALYREQLGVIIEQVSVDELIDLYERTTDEAAAALYTYFSDATHTEATPADRDLRAACRMGTALLSLLGAHRAAGGALACFDLIARTGTGACLGASYINGETPYFLACEGDLDSAVTMLLLRAVTDCPPFMANPSLGRDGTVSFSHCTAPLTLTGERSTYTLLCHHETGKSVSPAIALPEGAEVTLVRYGSILNRLTLSSAVTVTDRREPTCRTHVTVRPSNLAHYLDTVLGCHQILVFAPVEDRLRRLARLLGTEVC